MLGALILGFAAGVIGRVLVPGDVLRHMSGPASWAASLALGVAGAFVGYAIFTLGLGIGDDDALDLGGFIGALIGVLILLPVVTWFARRAGIEPPGKRRRRAGPGRP